MSLQVYPSGKPVPQERAVDNVFDSTDVEALMLNHEGEVEKCTSDNAFIATDGVLGTRSPVGMAAQSAPKTGACHQ